ncbi:BglG family transcription antiterminator [Tetragenococcus solitarius]|uniref:BglG family transcription antiterminator n=1 Tax=Tetragenococcus solitarius TaxID=71453 RepID=A0ABN3Y1C2_9ENTE|nr:BglG family transcription antiterminator [Tetragenococcus solitarius]
MGKDTQKNILSFLRKNKNRWVTSKELANFCNCTTRTIRNNVTKINQENPGLVFASRYGYQGSFTNNGLILGDEQNERKSTLFLLLLKSSERGIDLFELAERLFIAESTLKNDIQDLKTEIAHTKLQIVIQQNNVKLLGTERAKRSYMISLLYKEGDYQEKLKQEIQEMIGYISLEELEETIKNVLNRRAIYVNQYSMNNIVLHYAISIERIRQGNVITKIKKALISKDTYEFQTAKEITDVLSHAYHIAFSEEELDQLALLFIGLKKETQATLQNMELRQIVESKIIEVLKNVLEDVKTTYLIQLEDEQFFTKLAIHLQSLYDRSQYETFTRNTGLLDIKTAYPLTFDIAVYISSLIQEQLGIWFNDDEISFIALHIGSFLENKKEERMQIKVVLFVEDYHNIRTNMIKKLQDNFGNDIIIQNMDEKKELLNGDIILTTDRKKANQLSGSLFVHPLLTIKDLEKIEARINLKKKNIQNRLFNDSINSFIEPSLYFAQIDPAELTPEMLRKQMVDKMEKEHYVTSKFAENVEKREIMSPTSFPSGIAIPHSMEHDACKSGISIMTLQEPIVWNQYLVSIIALVAINKHESKPFNDFFEKFIEIVSDSVNVKELAMSDDFTELVFKLKLMFKSLA